MAGSLGHIAGTVSLNIDPFKQSTKVLQSEIRATGQAIKAQEAAFKSSGNSVAAMGAKYRAMGSQLKQYDALIAQQRSKYEGLKSSIGDVNNATDKQKASLTNAANALNKTVAASEALKGKYNQLGAQIVTNNSKWTSAGNAMGKVSGVTGTVGEKFTTLGNKTSGLSRAVGTGLVAGFGAAVKSAVGFDSQIAAMGPLLTNGGKVTGQFKEQLNQLSNKSKEWAQEYGISTTTVNDAMAEMIRRGYNAKQTMAAMPAVLDATKASGEDLSTVMHTSTSVLEQFGMKAKDTSKVTDTLNYLANATASGFSDMGEAMTYVGPTAHSAGISLQETAAAISLMSNKGIEGSVAGTALRGALTRLLKPSKQNVEGFKELGVNVADFKKGTLTLPDIIDKIKTNTKGWTAEQRASAIALAFGTEAQSGMNALIDAGGDTLREYTKKATDASGSTKKVADSMNSTEQAKVARMKEKFEVMAITLGEKLLPAVEPVFKEVGKLADAFMKLDPQTQKTIAKVLVATAAFSPFAKILGSVFSGTSKVAGGLGKLFTALGKAKTGASTSGKALEIAGDAVESVGGKSVKTGSRLGNLLKGLTGLGGGAAEAGTAMAGAGEATAAGGAAMEGAAASGGLLAAAMSPVGLAVIGTTAVVAAGVVAWNVWGKGAVASAERTRKWGSDVGKAADKSLNKMQNFSTSASNQLNNFGTAGKKNTAELNNTFKAMYSNLEQQAQKANQSATASEQKKNNAIVADAKQTTTNIGNILNNAQTQKRKLTDDEKQYMRNANRQMNEDEVNLLNISSSKKKAVIAALNNDITNMSKKQRTESASILEKSMAKENQVYDKQKAKIKDTYDAGKINSAEYEDALNKLANTHKSKTESMVASLYNLMKANGMSKDEITQKLSQIGVKYSDAADAAKKTAASVKNSNGILADSSTKAGKAWNELVLDPKTGEIKANTQEFLNETVKSYDGWYKMKLASKHANLTTNAKKIIAEAMLTSDQWNNLEYSERKALIDSNSGKVAEQALLDAGVWNNLTLDQKRAIVESNSSATIIQTMHDLGQWDALTWKEKKAVVNNKTAEATMQALQDHGTWDSLTWKQQQAIMTTNSKSAMIDVLTAQGQWDTLQFSEKEALVEDKATKPVMEAMQTAGTWDNLDMKTQQAIMKAQGLDQVAQAITQVGAWNQLPAKTKKLLANNTSAAKVLNDAGIDISMYNNKPVKDKKLKVDGSDIKPKMQSAKTMIDEYNSKTPVTKHLKADATQHNQQFGTAKSQIDSFNQKSPKEKKPKASTGVFNDMVQGAIDKVTAFNGKPVKTKTATANVSQHNQQFGTAEQTIDKHNNKKVNQKTATANASQHNQAFQGAISKVGQYNSTNPNHKTATANASSVTNAMGNGMSYINNYNGTGINYKTAGMGHSDIDSAKSAWDNFLWDWNSQPTFMSKTVTVAKHIISSVGSMFHFAKGTKGSPEGISILGDGGREEPYYNPRTGLFGISPAVDTPTYLDKGTIVWPSISDFEKKLPHFATGTANSSRALESLSKLPNSIGNAQTTYNDSHDSAPVVNYEINISVPESTVNADTPQKMRQLAEAIIQQMKRIDKSGAIGRGETF